MKSCININAWTETVYKVFTYLTFFVKEALNIRGQQECYLVQRCPRMLKYSTHLTVKEIHKIKYSTIHLLIFSYVFWLVYGHAFFVGVYDVFYCYKLARLTNVQWTAYLLTYLLSIQFTLSKNSTDSHNTKYTRFASHRAALISVSVALSQTSAYTARPRTRG